MGYVYDEFMKDPGMNMRRFLEIKIGYMKWFDPKKQEWSPHSDDWIQVTNGKCVIEMTWLNYTINHATLERKRTQNYFLELVLQCSTESHIHTNVKMIGPRRIGNDVYI